MRSKQFLVRATIAVSGGWVIVGCDRAAPPSPAPAAISAPATSGQQPQAVAVPTTAPTTAPATQPAVTQLLINQLFTQFPAAQLRLVNSDNHLTAVLYTSDPPAAINNDYTGNSYYLEMPLEQVTDASGINGAEWRFKSMSSDRSDSHDGIFLDGFHHQLQPIDVLVRFEGSGPTLRLRLAGDFMDYDNDRVNQPGVLTAVAGDLLAEVDAPLKK